MRDFVNYIGGVLTGGRAFRAGREFEEALSACLERVAMGEDPYTCAERYPAFAGELLPLLGVARATSRLTSEATYSPAAKARGLARLSRAIAENGVSAGRRPWSPGWRLMARPVAIGFAVVVLAGVAAGGTTAAAADSIPGDKLYWVKTTRENVGLRFRRSDEDLAQAHAALANERGREMQQLIVRGRVRQAEQHVGRLLHHLSLSAGFAGVRMSQDPVEMPPGRVGDHGPDPAWLRSVLQRDEQLLKHRLTELLPQVQPGQRQRVLVIMRESDLGYRVIIESLQPDDGPRPGPFWRPIPRGAEGFPRAQ